MDGALTATRGERPIPVGPGMLFRALAAALLVLPPGVVAGQAADSPSAPPDLTALDPSELMQVEVTSVSRKRETRWRTPAAISVVTRDDIRRSGATSVVEALRLVPGLHVARIDSNKWAVGVRGFASGLTRSLLVMIDGRTVYSPLFAGTYWEAQDVLLEDVERIEVIRGPGGSLWGANAVNGVVNVITRSSRETQGTYASVAAGSQERVHAAARYGGASGEKLTYRVYGKGFDRGPGYHPAGNPFDEWSMGQAGFRADWENGAADTVEVHGNVYHGDAGHRVMVTTLAPPSIETVDGETRLGGRDLTARWRHLSRSGAEWALRAYYDHTLRRETTFGESRDTADVEVQRQSTHGRHDVIVGGGYRLSSGDVESVPSFQFVPARRTDSLWSAFFRDEISFREGELVLALGSKLEHNDYSGIEVQPTVQALWAPRPALSLWGVLARAVRTPARLEHDLTLTTLADPAGPVFIRLLGNPDFLPEKILTASMGARFRVSGSVAAYATGFHNTHRDLFGFEASAPVVEATPTPRVVVPVLIRNGVRGTSYGLEAGAEASPTQRWVLSASYSLLRLQLEAVPGVAELSHPATNRGSPRHTLVVESRLDAGRRVDLDVMLRHVSELATVPSYTALDARVAWRPRPPLELAIVGQNLLRPHHLEFENSGNVRVEARRGMYGSITWRR